MARKRSEVGAGQPVAVPAAATAAGQIEIPGTAASAPAAAPAAAAPTTAAPAALPPVPAGPFATAPGQAGLPKGGPLARGFEEVVRDLFAEGYEVLAEYDAIQAGLTIRGALLPARVQQAANDAEELARRASKLAIVAEVERDAYMRRTEPVVAAMREAATGKLERDKAAGLRTKQITDADVTAAIAQLYPDEWEDVQDKRAKASGMLHYLRDLADNARSRCHTVRRLLNPADAG